MRESGIWPIAHNVSPCVVRGYTQRTPRQASIGDLTKSIRNRALGRNTICFAIAISIGTRESSVIHRCKTYQCSSCVAKVPFRVRDPFIN
jgi:hypothetical protein